jgi:hypothetical protein
MLLDVAQLSRVGTLEPRSHIISKAHPALNALEKKPRPG